MKGYLYIIQSLKNSKYYIGSTNNLIKRLKEHNNKKSKYTKLTVPWKLAYKQEFATVKEARQKEYKLKQQKSRKIIEKLISGRLAQW